MANLSMSPSAAPVTTKAPTTTSGVTRRPGRLWLFLRTQPVAAVALLVILAFVVLAIFAPLIAPYGPTEQIRTAIQHPPDGQFLFGTDDLGRDVFSRVLYGARTSILISVTTVVISGTVGTAIGILSGYFGGRWLDSLLQRFMDAIIAVPGLVLLLFIAAVLGPSVRNTIVALTILIVPSFSRLARGEMLRVREEPYVEAARANGAGVLRILFRHGLPNLFAPLMVVTSLLFAGVLIAESALSFLGIGTPPPTASWGRMLSEGTRFLEISPWMVIFPGGALTLAVLAFNLLGDGLRDFLDPRSRR
jgi:ABC-type dipeptide/oligopeptide/nickel transport system permease subunit